MGRTVPSAEVADASKGLPSLVIKDGEVYGLLRGAEAPMTTDEDSARAAALDAAVQQFLVNEPSADTEAVLNFVDRWEWDRVSAEQSLADSLDLTHLEAADSVLSSCWVDVDRTVAARLVSTIRSAVHGVKGSDAFVRTTLPRHISALARSACFDDWVLYRSAVKEEVDSNLAQAWTHFVTSLLVGDSPNAASLWRLGEISRSQGFAAEAACWFDLCRATVLVDGTVRQLLRESLPLTAVHHGRSDSV